MARNNQRYETSFIWRAVKPNLWDFLVLTIVLMLLAVVAYHISKIAIPYQEGSTPTISLSPYMLPQYAVATVLRMFVALFFSLLFTFSVAPLAAKNPRIEKFMIPLIDVLQSLPVLGMLSLAIVGFMIFLPNSLLGPELAAIFAIFTSQVWNMVLSLYQSLKTVPQDLNEAAHVFKLSAWQKYWRIEVPFATPALLWNTMVSMSAGWFFVVYSEAINVANQTILLPGIGSYISEAIRTENIAAMLYAIFTMLIVILLYDQLLFSPLLAWAEKFKFTMDEEQEKNSSWFLDLLAKTNLFSSLEKLFDTFTDWMINKIKFVNKYTEYDQQITYKHQTNRSYYDILLLALIIMFASIFAWIVYTNIPISEIAYVLYLGCITALKVIILIILASLIWIPIGVAIGLNPKATMFMQPLIQFLAAFPANFFYPIVVLGIIKYNLNHNIWTMPLMILGTQWYILFNAISGVAAIPRDLRYAAKNLGVRGWLWWRKLILPGIFPHYITGAMTAAGGCWNASIVAEWVPWGDVTITSVGLGHYITEHTTSGDFIRISLGIGVMCLYVMLFNRFLWNKLYKLAATRYGFGG